MLRTIQDWVWKGTMDPPLEKLEVWTEINGEEDHIGSEVALELSRLVTTLEGNKEAFERRLLAERAGASNQSPANDTAEFRELAKSILPTMDALDRITEYGQKYESGDETFRNWLKSVEATRIRLRKTLEGIGLIAISSVGSEVDFEVHDVVAVVPAGNYMPNTVVEERQKGYYFRGKLIRDAKVVVAQ